VYFPPPGFQQAQKKTITFNMSPSGNAWVCVVLSVIKMQQKLNIFRSLNKTGAISVLHIRVKKDFTTKSRCQLPLYFLPSVFLTSPGWMHTYMRQICIFWWKQSPQISNIHHGFNVATLTVTMEVWQE